MLYYNGLVNEMENVTWPAWPWLWLDLTQVFFEKKQKDFLYYGDKRSPGRVEPFLSFGSPPGHLSHFVFFYPRSRRFFFIYELEIFFSLVCDEVKVCLCVCM